MSHKASCWLASLPPCAMNGSAFRVLFHLCDAHNSAREPDTACFPSQKLLMEKTGLSNGGLNNAINALEAAGLVVRRRTRCPDGTRGPTYYILGCDYDHAPPSPQNGGGEPVSDPVDNPVDKPVDNLSSNSKLEGKPTPNSGANQLHPGGDKPVIDPLKEPYARAREPAPRKKQIELAAELIRKRKPFLCRNVTSQLARECIAAGLVTAEDCRRSDIPL